jgi:hypothetical protein
MVYKIYSPSMINFVHDFLYNMGQIVRPVEAIPLIPDFTFSTRTASFRLPNLALPNVPSHSTTDIQPNKEALPLPQGKIPQSATFIETTYMEKISLEMSHKCNLQ